MPHCCFLDIDLWHANLQTKCNCLQLDSGDFTGYKMNAQ